MNIYSYFTSAWEHLKDFFSEKKSIEQEKIHDAKASKAHLVNEIESAKYFSHSEEGQEFSSRTLRLILKKTKIYNLFEKFISDSRRIASTKYSASSLLMHALLTLILRQQSKNAFHDKEVLSPHLKSNVAKLIQAPSTPASKTVEDFMLQMNKEELESILPNLFRFLLRGKFFQQHSEFKAKWEDSEENFFLLGIDAEITHTYYDSNQHPVASCPYCLKRTRGNTSWYVHCTVSLCVIGEKNFVFPLFLYRVRANHAWERESDEELKQQCELSALPFLLEKFRTFFPKLKAAILLDSLYAGGPAMNTCEQFKVNYMIVRKSGSLKSLNSNILGLKKLQLPQKRMFSEGVGIKNKQLICFQIYLIRVTPLRLLI